MIWRSFRSYYSNTWENLSEDLYAYYSYEDGKNRYVLITVYYKTELVHVGKDGRYRRRRIGNPVLKGFTESEFRKEISDRGCPIEILEDFDNDIVRDFVEEKKEDGSEATGASPALLVILVVLAAIVVYAWVSGIPLP